MMPVTIVLKNETLSKIRAQKEHMAPFFLWGDDPVTGDVFRSSALIRAGRYWLHTTIDGVEEKVVFVAQCGPPP
jgi:hypothetical protein